MFPEREKITVSVRDCEHRLKTVSNLDEDKMISLLNFSRYYDKLELPIPRNRDKVLEDFSNAGAPLVAILRKCSGKSEKMVIFISKLPVAI